MRISQAYLSRLESGERSWVGDLAARFALAIGFPVSLISFAPSDTSSVPERNGERAAEAPDSPQGARDGAAEYSATCTATTGR
jgi:transcriptional regulator with XRE-family HTH domain